jgi:cysteine-rich repeat protein
MRAEGKRARPFVGILALVATLIAGCAESDIRPPSDTLTGHASDASGNDLAGVMITAYDAQRFMSISVFSAGDGRFQFPPLAAGSYRLRARRIGFTEGVYDDVAMPTTSSSLDFTLQATADFLDQLPPTYFHSLLQWPSARVQGDFARTCANCHQIGDHRWRKPRSASEWETVVNRMIGYGIVPFYPETRALLIPTLAATFSPTASAPSFAAPAAPAGDATRAIIYEWEIDPVDKPGCHDLELGTDGTVYTVSGMYALNPTTGARHHYPIQGGGHSVERDGDGNMWITAPGPEELIKFDVTTGETSHYRQPRIGDDLGSYPHTLRFDDQGRIWYTLSRSNHVCRFDPATATFTYYRLPDADPTDSGVPIPVPYGCSVAPDQSVWWSQLFGHKIGRIDPESGAVTAWRPPFDGPRRLGVGPDNVVWVPGYGSSELGRFDPATETWTVYPLPSIPRGSELPYNLNVNLDNGEVWINGSNSDSMIRFEPAHERFTVYQLPTPGDFTREIEFDADGNVWTCTSEQEIAPGVAGTGRIIKIERRPREGICGDRQVQLGEECDDGNAVSCDGCSADCLTEQGCGDGTPCGAEACDDGNRDRCDGCSDTCELEPGYRCGDGTANPTCGEECDPPGDLCTVQCQRVAVCGDGFTDGEEACDDGNRGDCDGCSADCLAEGGCGDGVACGTEACDDGNTASCDGCSASCAVEIGAHCGDGIVHTDCGEECDPPGSACSFTCTRQPQPLGTRRLTFGGGFYSSPLGTGLSLGTLHGEMDIEAGTPDTAGIAPLSVAGPLYYSAAILGGTFGNLCVRVDGCDGIIDCDGNSPVDVLTVQDSAGPGVQNNALMISTGLGEDGSPGAVELRCQQTFVQLAAGAGSQCTDATYPAPVTVAYTTGRTEAYFTNANPKVGDAMIALQGEPFSCAGWRMTDGPGQLAGAYLQEENDQAGDVANINVIDD